MTNLDKVREALETGSEVTYCDYDDACDFEEKCKAALSALSAHEEEVRELVAVVQKVVKWNADYPSHRIYSETSIRRIAAEMDAIAAEATAALAKVKE